MVQDTISKNPKKIIHIIARMKDEASGPSYSVMRLLENIQLSEKEILTIGDTIYGDSNPLIKSFQYSLGPQRLGLSNQLRKYLKENAKTSKIRLIHNHGMWMMPNIYPAKISKKYNLPLVYSPRGSLSKWALRHGSMVKKFFYPLFQHPALKSTTLFHSTAKSEYNEIRENNFTQPISIIPNGVDIPGKINIKEKNIPTLLFLSRIHPKKGIESLLKAWKLNENNHIDWRLEIVGEGERNYIIELNKIIKQLELKRVAIRKPVFGIEKSKLYFKSNLLILPTNNENFGMVVAEALAHGVPTIVSKEAPWGKINQMEAGWSVENNVESYAHAIDHAMKMQFSDLKKMGENGRKWMQNEYAWDSIGTKMLQTYLWLETKSINDKPDFIHLQ